MAKITRNSYIILKEVEVTGKVLLELMQITRNRLREVENSDYFMYENLSISPAYVNKFYSKDEKRAWVDKLMDLSAIPGATKKGLNQTIEHKIIIDILNDNIDIFIKKFRITSVYTSSYSCRIEYGMIHHVIQGTPSVLRISTTKPNIYDALIKIMQCIEIFNTNINQAIKNINQILEHASSAPSLTAYCSVIDEHMAIYKAHS